MCILTRRARDSERDAMGGSKGTRERPLGWVMIMCVTVMSERESFDSVSGLAGMLIGCLQ